MTIAAPIPQARWRSAGLPALVITVALLILAGVIAATTQRLRLRLQDQIVGRDGAVLHAVALMHQREFEEDNVEVGDLLGQSDDPDNQFTILLKTSRLAGVLAARQFDADGAFVDSFPAHVVETNLDAAALAHLRELKPHCHFAPAVPLDEIFLALNRENQPAAGVSPLLIVSVPMEGREAGQLAGVGQFIIEGHHIAAEFARLDRNLLLQAVVAFLAGGGILIAVIGWAFHRLRSAQRQLARRNQELLRANEELTLSAKTSALGTLTAHLVHGLSSPLSGLQDFMHSRSRESGGEDGAWQEAIASTRQMKNLIGEVVRLLASERQTECYENSLSDVAANLETRTRPVAQAAGVRLETSVTADDELSGRTANLALVILENLVTNAIQASARGSVVRVSVRSSSAGVACEVRDQGSGLPETARRTLFTPSRSTKPGGHGIGLAISRQLALQIGARLELKETNARGTAFVLTLPAAVLAAAPSLEETPA